MTLNVRSQRRRASEELEKEVNGFITSREGCDKKRKVKCRACGMAVHWLAEDANEEG